MEGFPEDIFMKITSIKSRLFLLTAGFGILIMLLIVVIIPPQASKLATGVMDENAFFISNLLSDNLALGMQTLSLDNGAALDQTLGLLKTESGENSIIQTVAIFDPSMNFVKGINGAGVKPGEKTDKPIVTSNKKQTVIFCPMRDANRSIIGYVHLQFSKKKLNDQTGNFIRFGWIIGSILLIIVVAAGFSVAQSIIRPVRSTIEMLKSIADGEGDLTQRLTYTADDEIGTLSQWFNTFVLKLQKTVKEIAGSTRSLTEFSSDFSTVSSNTGKSATDLRLKARTVSSAAEGVSSALEEMSSSANAMSTSVGAISISISEMSLSINEVAKNCHQELQISNDADRQSKEALMSMNELGIKAQNIGKIVELIKNVAAQTNLLALNATIEAASAGEAGKGFAVVAMEVKELAKQTAQATESINTNIIEMQEKTVASVKVIEMIASIVNQINSISHTIVSAVEEQSATANEISNNVNQTNSAASGIAKQVTSSAEEIRKVFQIIQEVDKVANENENSSKQMVGLVNEYTNLTGKLNSIVNQFKV
jgi:methyl-accepting chemotaxis protein